jgi:hypothetical protein
MRRQSTVCSPLVNPRMTSSVGLLIAISVAFFFAADSLSPLDWVDEPGGCHDDN